MYYACFYAVCALLNVDRIEVSGHSGVRQKFGEHFVKTGRFDKDLTKHITELSKKDRRVIIMILLMSVLRIACS